MDRVLFLRNFCLFSDGPMCVTDNQGNAPNYYPNSFEGPEPSQRARKLEPPFPVAGDVDRFEDTEEEEDYSQARVFWNKVLNDGERQRLAENIADHLSDAAEFIQERAITNFAKVNSELARMVSVGLKSQKK